MQQQRDLVAAVAPSFMVYMIWTFYPLRLSTFDPTLRIFIFLHQNHSYSSVSSRVAAMGSLVPSATATHVVIVRPAVLSDRT